MIFLLAFILSILTIVTYHVNGKDLLTPSIWLLFGFDASILLSITQYSVWGDISFRTFLVIIIGCSSFIIGSLLGNHIKSNNVNPTYVEVSLRISPVFAWISLLFISAVAFFNYRYTSSLAYNRGFSGGSDFLTYARVAMDENSMSYGLYVSIAISQVITFVLFYHLVKRIIYKERMNMFIPEILSQVVFIIVCLLSTGRTMLLHYLIYVFSVICILMKAKNNWSTRNNNTIIKFGLITIFVILASFWIIDSRLRASMYGTERAMWDQITKYSASSIYALDRYLENVTYAANDGRFETLYNVFSVLRRLGLKVTVGSNALPFIKFSNVSTNIYTAFRRYIHDFGYIGFVILEFMIGLLYQNAYIRIKKGNSTLFGFILYAMFVYAVVYTSIEERFIINVLSLRSLILIVSLYVVLVISGGVKRQVSIRFGNSADKRF